MKKTEIDSYEKLFYWMDSMIMKYSGTDKAKGIRKLRDFVQSRRDSGWKWEDIADWAVYSTSTTSETFDPFSQTLFSNTKKPPQQKAGEVKNRSTSKCQVSKPVSDASLSSIVFTIDNAFVVCTPVDDMCRTKVLEMFAFIGSDNICHITEC